MENKEFIERGAVIDILRKYSTENPSSLGRHSGVADIAMCEVDRLPAADVVEVVHGEWCWEGKFKACSKCGSYVEWNETLGANFWKYCPFCGAKMDGGNRNADA